MSFTHHASAHKRTDHARFLLCNSCAEEMQKL
jgi:hypothetical protein